METREIRSSDITYAKRKFKWNVKNKNDQDSYFYMVNYSSSKTGNAN